MWHRLIEVGRHRSSILLAVGVLVVVLVTILITVPPAPGRTFYVSPSGDDANPGTEDLPWRSLSYAMERLSAGDLLNLRVGIYHEHDLRVGLRGTSGAPITIRSYPGERATIDGGVPFFKEVPNSEWELVDDSIQLYRSKRSFSGSVARGWLVDLDVQLIEYGESANLEATNYGPVDGMARLYMGPGLQLRSDGHIYIRLQSNPNDLIDASGAPVASRPADTNPNHNRIAVFTSGRILLLDGAQYLRFKDLSFANSMAIMDVRNGSHHVELEGSRLDYGTYGLVVRDGVRDWSIRNNEFNNGLPDYVYWTDVKNGTAEVAEGYPEFQSAAIVGSLPRFEISDNTFRNTFDVLDVHDGTFGTRMRGNTFKYVRDDAIELDRGVGNVEVAQNLFWHVGSGISIDPSNAPPGPVYIHHNVIDNSAYQHGGRPGNYRASNWPVWTTIDPFSDHDSGNKAARWRVYNNTIVTRRSGYDWNAAGPSRVSGNPEKYVYNNIFFVMDDRIVFRDDRTTAGSHYDGNVIYRVAPGRYPLFYRFGDGKDYYSLAEFRKRSGTNWEVNGLEIDPGFDVSEIDDPTFDPATIWDRYVPTNSAVLAAGVSYDGLNWPGMKGVGYRGALAPK